MLELPLLAVVGDRMQQREKLLAIVGMQPFDEEAGVTGAFVGREAEAAERAAGGVRHLQRLGVGFEDDRLQAAEEIDDRRRVHLPAEAASRGGQ